MKEESYLSFDQVTMPLAINFLIIQKDTILDSWAHEMIVTGTGSEAAAYCGTWLLAELTPLQKQKENKIKLISSKTRPPLLLSVGGFFGTDRSLEKCLISCFIAAPFYYSNSHTQVRDMEEVVRGRRIPHMEQLFHLWTGSSRPFPDFPACTLYPILTFASFTCSPQYFWTEQG